MPKYTKKDLFAALKEGNYKEGGVTDILTSDDLLHLTQSEVADVISYLAPLNKFKEMEAWLPKNYARTLESFNFVLCDETTQVRLVSYFLSEKQDEQQSEQQRAEQRERHLGYVNQLMQKTKVEKVLKDSTFIQHVASTQDKEAALMLLKRGKEICGDGYKEYFFKQLHRAIYNNPKHHSFIENAVLHNALIEYDERADKGAYRKWHGATQTVKDLTLLMEIAEQVYPFFKQEADDPLNEASEEVQYKVSEFEISLIAAMRDQRPKAAFSKSGAYGHTFNLFKGQAFAVEHLSHTDELIQQLGAEFRKLQAGPPGQ